MTSLREQEQEHTYEKQVKPIGRLKLTVFIFFTKPYTYLRDNIHDNILHFCLLTFTKLIKFRQIKFEVNNIIFLKNKSQLTKNLTILA